MGTATAALNRLGLVDEHKHPGEYGVRAEITDEGRLLVEQWL